MAPLRARHQHGYRFTGRLRNAVRDLRGIIRRAAGDELRNPPPVSDISHMGEAHLIAADARHETVGAALEALVPCDVLGLRPGQQRYTQLLNDGGGIIDDLMVTRFANRSEDGKLLLILNASRKEVDCAYIAELLPPGVHLEPKPDRALLALQGPNSASVLAGFAPQSAELRFLQAAPVFLSGIDCYISRSGYTGEDGFEISVPAAAVAQLWEALIRSNEVRPCGLGARDSLRLEAGLCLYGHELDETTSPIEAALAWSIQKRRRQDGGFPGASRIQREIEHGTTRLRAGILPEGRAPARENTDVLSPLGLTIGIVTSGGFSPDSQATDRDGLHRTRARAHRQRNQISGARKCARRAHRQASVCPPRLCPKLERVILQQRASLQRLAPTIRRIMC